MVPVIVLTSALRQGIVMTADLSALFHMKIAPLKTPSLSFCQ